MGPPAGSRPKDKGKGKPKIRNSRRYRYRIGGEFGTSSRQPAKRQGKREGKTKNQKFEAVYTRRVPGDLQPAAGQKTRKEKREGKPKIRNLRRYRIGAYFGYSGRQPAKRQRKEREREREESQISEI